MGEKSVSNARFRDALTNANRLLIDRKSRMTEAGPLNAERR
jgi:hypothetical protein